MKLNEIIIKVNRFGPLEKVSFKLAPMMIFTGKSSLGKSYANYLVYYFMSSVCNGKLLDIIGEDVENEEETRQYDFKLDDFFKNLSEQAENFMRKFLGDDELKCDVEFKSPKKKRTFTIKLKKYKTNTIKEEERHHDPLFHAQQPYEIDFNDEYHRLVPSFNFARFLTQAFLIDFVLGKPISRAVILPPGRGAFVGENFSLKSEVASSMNMYNLYFRDYDYGINSKIGGARKEFEHLSDRLLKLTSGGELYSVEGKQYLKLNDKQKIALSAGASSVKDLSPWLFYLRNYSFPYSICMEEPEAHQHPSVTVQIAEVMAITMHQKASCIFHLTTHSDYLIQRLNQLVKLGGIRRKDKDLYKKICRDRGLDTQSYLDAKDIQAYYFSKNEKGGTVVEAMEVTDEGIPMKSFFDVVRDLAEKEDYINDAIYSLEKRQQ